MHYGKEGSWNDLLDSPPKPVTNLSNRKGAQI